MEYFTTTSKPSRRAVDCVIVGVYARNRLGQGADTSTGPAVAVSRSS